jgi:hypothetical protein
MTRARTASLATLLLVLAAWPVRAEDDVDLQVRGNEKVDGTIRPADEGERFPYAAPRGALLSASVKRKGTGGPTPILEVLDAGFGVIATGTPTPTGAKLTKYEFLTSSLHRVRIAGDGAKDGDYQLKLKASPRLAWDEKAGGDVGPGAMGQFSFAAPAGAKAAFTLAAAKHSAFVPHLLAVDGPNGFHFVFPAPASAAPRQRVANVPLGATGEYVVHFQNDGASAGGWTMGVKLAASRITKVSVDIRDDALGGTFAEGAQAFGRIIDGAGGLVDPSSVGGVLTGTSVSVDEESLPSASVIAISASDTFFVDDANHPAGVAIKLTPAGTQFAKPVTVTVPFDPQAFDDPLTELTIYIQDSETGALEAVPQNQLVIDTDAATVSFPTSHFSRFQGTSPKDRPVKGTFAHLEIGGRPLPMFGGSVVFGLSRVDALKGPRTGNSVTRTNGRRAIAYSPSNIGYSPAPMTTETGTIQIVDDSTVMLSGLTGGPSKFRRGRSPDVLIEQPATAAAGATLSLVLRVAQGTPTLSNLAGDWQYVTYEVTAGKDAGGATLLTTSGQRGRLNFGLDGVVKASNVATRTATAGEPGEWRELVGTEEPANGSLLAGQGRLTLQMQLGDSGLISSMDLVPVLKGEVLVGVTDAVEGSSQSPSGVALRMAVLVRKAKSAGPAALGTRNFFSSVGVLPIDRPGATQDFGYYGDDLVIGRNGRGGSHLLGARVASGHDANGAPQVFAPVIVDKDAKYSLQKDGLYRETAPLDVGAFAPRAGFYVVTEFAGLSYSLGFGVVAPPGQ